MFMFDGLDDDDDEKKERITCCFSFVLCYAQDFMCRVFIGKSNEFWVLLG